MRPVLARRRERAFERVYQRHVGDVYRYALVVLSDEQDAEDVTKTTFRSAYHRFGDRRGPRSELTGLLSIAYDVCRRRGGHPWPDESVLVEDRVEPSESMSCREAERAVSRELDDALTRRERLSLRLHLASCEPCGAFARGQQAQRTALRALAAVPLPPALQVFSAERKFLGAPASS